jgi:hypothetical protein
VDNEKIKQHLEMLMSMRNIVQDTWDMIERYIAPYRGRFFKDEMTENSVEWRRPWIYDSTAVAASQNLSAFIHASLTSPKIRWFDLRFRSGELNNDRDAVAWLDSVSELMYRTLQDSNFTVQAGETYQDLVDFGTSVIVEETLSEDEWEGINFTSVPLKQCYFEQDHMDKIENFYRILEWTPIQMVAKFGDEGVPQRLRDAANNPQQANVKEKIIFCIWRRKHVDVKRMDLYKPIPTQNRPYGYKYMTLLGLENLGEEGGYYEMPAFVPRWRKTSSSMWGNSPAMVALSDTITLNKLVEMQIAAMEKVIDPATITTERGLLGDLDLNAGGLTVVRSMDDIRPFESAARFDVSYQEIQRYRDQIREYFMIDQLILPPMEGTPATATEIAARIGQLERLIGPTLGRLQMDFLDPCVTRTFNILMRAGQIPPPPSSVANAPTGLDIEYVGALARSQQQDQVTAVDRWIFQIGQLAAVNPDVLDIPDWDALVKGTGLMLGVPAKFMNSDREIKNKRSEREEQQKAMAEAQIAEQQGKAMEAQANAESTTTGGM